MIQLYADAEVARGGFFDGAPKKKGACQEVHIVGGGQRKRKGKLRTTNGESARTRYLYGGKPQRASRPSTKKRATRSLTCQYFAFDLITRLQDVLKYVHAQFVHHVPQRRKAAVLRRRFHKVRS